ncbi:MAG TPA: hypothetical protein VFG35_09930 [Actinoplanes sp.]|nr:hypothetical protein [Actinoplanes sp.]
MTTLVVASLSAREVGRRRTALILVIALPFWSAREIGTYAVDGGSIDLVWRGLAHAGLTWLICSAGTLAIFRWRLRLACYPEPFRNHS